MLSSATRPAANTAIGAQALFQNSTGTDNTAIGYAALSHNTTGSGNTAIGLSALNQRHRQLQHSHGICALGRNTELDAPTSH